MKNKKIIIMYIITIIFIVFTIFFFSYAFYQRGVVSDKYMEAQKLVNEGNYDEAIEYLKYLTKYKDGYNFLSYSEANKLLNDKKYKRAIEKFNDIIDFKDSANKIKDAKYELAKQYFDSEKYDDAKQLFLELDDYEEYKKDVEYYLGEIQLKEVVQLTEDIYNKACNLMNKGKYNEAIKNFKSISDYSDSKEKIKFCEDAIKRLKLSHTIFSGVSYIGGINKNKTVLFAGELPEGHKKKTSWEDIISIDGYGSFSVGLKNNGTVKALGYINGNQKADISNWKNIIDIAAGERYIVGLKNDGTVVATGHNGDKQCNIKGDEWNNIIDIDTGWRFTVGLTKKHELVFAGVAEEQRLQYEKNKEQWKDVVKISASGGDPDRNNRGKGHTVGLKSDGTVVAIGDSFNDQCKVNGKEWTDIKDIAAGDWYTVGLKNDKTIVFTGTNPNGSKYIDYDTLKKLNKKKDVVDIAAGYGQTVFLHEDGTVTVMWFDIEDNKTVSEWRILSK